MKVRAPKRRDQVAVVSAQPSSAAGFFDKARGRYHRFCAADPAAPAAFARVPRIRAVRASRLILDDWGPEPLTADQRCDLLEIVDDRYDKGSLLIISQVPVSQWHDVIADPTLGDAILDRIIHNAHRIELKGDSLRRRTGEKKEP